MREGILMCVGFFLMSSDCVPVVLAGILFLAAAGFLAGAYSGETQAEQKEKDAAMSRKSNHKIVICHCCGELEYLEKMMRLSGRCLCRSCYKTAWERQTKKIYTWDDLDGPRPTVEEYLEQEEKASV